MPAALRADPELIGLPRHARRRIAEIHLGAASLTPDVQVDFAHVLRFYYDDRVIPAIVLAAGKSSRMGRPKATLRLDGGDTFRDADRQHVRRGAGFRRHHRRRPRCGRRDRRVRGDRSLSARFVENPDYEQGQLSSLLAGLRVVDRPGVVAALVTLVDVPLVGVSTVRAVVDRYRATHAPIVRPVRGAEHGHPVLIDRSLFDALRHADPREGAKAVVRSHASAAGDVAVEDAGAFADADTPDRVRATPID